MTKKIKKGKINKQKWEKRKRKTKKIKSITQNINKYKRK